MSVNLLPHVKDLSDWRGSVTYVNQYQCRILILPVPGKHCTIYTSALDWKRPDQTPGGHVSWVSCLEGRGLKKRGRPVFPMQRDDTLVHETICEASSLSRFHERSMPHHAYCLPSPSRELEVSTRDKVKS